MLLNTTKILMKTLPWIVLIVLLNTLFCGFVNRSQNVGSDVGIIDSLSYAPFRDGQDPLQGIFPSDQQLEEDIALLSKMTHNIRTYSSAEGNMAQIPLLAKKYGLTMLQGAWLSPVKADNDAEIEEVIRCANTYPEVVKRIVVGNEVLLRGDLDVDELIAAIRQVKKAVQQPVTYADVWSIYLKYPQIIPEVDFVTIHILPYWEDEPVTVEEAPGHVLRIYQQVRQLIDSMLADKAILIGESGWPSLGKQRGRAVPSILNQAQYVRAFIALATQHHFDYNLVEAFNQPWKSQLEGTVGANWGIYDSFRQPVFPLIGPVSEQQGWVRTLIVTTMLFLAIVLLFYEEVVNLPQVRLVSFLGGAQCLSSLFIRQMQTLWETSYSNIECLQSLIFLGCCAFMLGFFLKRLAVILTAARFAPDHLGERLYYGLLFFCIYSFYKTMLLAWDGRYIDFPTMHLAIVVMGLLILSVVNYGVEKKSLAQSWHITALLGYVPRKPSCLKQVGYWLVLVGFALIIGESVAMMNGRDFISAYPQYSERLGKALFLTLTNLQLIVWLVSLGVLATPFFMSCQKAASS
jgi:exo-beta-1,3-glucanase (GH17 family)